MAMDLEIGPSSDLGVCRARDSSQEKMSHVTYKCDISRMNESCHIRMGHVTMERVSVQSLRNK